METVTIPKTRLEKDCEALDALHKKIFNHVIADTHRWAASNKINPSTETSGIFSVEVFIRLANLGFKPYLVIVDDLNFVCVQCNEHMLDTISGFYMHRVSKIKKGEFAIVKTLTTFKQIVDEFSSWAPDLKHPRFKNENSQTDIH